MSRKLLLSFVVLLCLTGQVVTAQQSVQLMVEQGNFVPYHPYSLIFGHEVVFSLKVVNNSPEACSYEPSFGWHLYSPDGAQWNDLRLTSTPEFDCPGLVYYSGGVPGSGDDSVGVVCPDGVIIDGYDEIAFKLTLQLSSDWQNNGKMICIDTVGYGGPTGFQWVWGGQECPDVVPSWLDMDGGRMNSGGRCFEITAGPDTAPEWWWPANVMGSHCGALSAQYDSNDPGGDLIIRYALKSGPGEIDSVTGLWTWDGATLDDVGEAIPLEVSAIDDWLRQWPMQTNVIVTNQAPVFTRGCKAYPVQLGVQFTAPFSASDVCPDDPREFLVLDGGGLIGEYGFTDSVLTILAEGPGMSNLTMTVGVTDGVDTDICYVELYTACCGKYTGGYTGNTDCDPEGIRNLTDVTRLIDNIYLSREPLCCPENGDVDGDPENKINLTDVTRLIDHIYLSKAETAPCD